MEIGQPSSNDDIYKRRFQRTKSNDGHKPVYIAQQDVSDKDERLSFKLLAFPTIILATLVLTYFIVRLHSVNLWNPHQGSRHTYVSHIEVEWDDISTVVSKIASRQPILAVGLLNFNEMEIFAWKTRIFPHGANRVVLHLDYVDKNMTWNSLYPAWIDEEGNNIPNCPNLPKIDVPVERLDVIVVKLPYRNNGSCSRDVARLHLQLASASLAILAKRDYTVHLLFISNCTPIPNLFPCKVLLARQGNAWLYEPNLKVLRKKLQLPIGSCELALPLNHHDRYYVGEAQREAYVTILHSSDVYVCGAIVVAQSIRMVGSTRDLVILVDETISNHHRNGLELAGWNVRTIQRIRNPRAKKGTYNEWNYSKFRIWQLTDYEKVIFIDADLLILRNIDFLFQMPEISAVRDNMMLFNSGLMVIEPSNCTFQLLMDHIDEITSYNGGDQGYLNEIFTWWHRIPKHMNFFKQSWEGDSDESKEKKTRIIGANPPILYALHYFGRKPWMCYRDYDCNWNVDVFRIYANDEAHNTWWKVHDVMPRQLQQFCLLSSKQKEFLAWDRKKAQEMNFSDGHWKIEIQDPRKN